MTSEWFPSELRVDEFGSTETITRVLELFAPEESFHYAEIGFYRGATVLPILDRRANCRASLFDYDKVIQETRPKFKPFETRVEFFGSSQKYLDSYNWSLIQLFAEHGHQPVFDYVYIDGAHTFAIDGLAFFLCDRLLKPGGYMEFDDYHWRIKWSSLDPKKVPLIGELYTPEQIRTKNVKLIVDHLVKPDPRYRELAKNRVYQKQAL